MSRQRAVIVDMDGTLCDVSVVNHLQAEPDGFTAFHEARVSAARRIRL